MQANNLSGLVDSLVRDIELDVQWLGISAARRAAGPAPRPALGAALPPAPSEALVPAGADRGRQIGP
jgi:hypothetical protein